MNDGPPQDALWELYAGEDGDSDAWAYGEDRAWRYLPSTHPDSGDVEPDEWTVLDVDSDGVGDSRSLTFDDLLGELPARVWPWAAWAADGVIAQMLIHSAEAIAEWEADRGSVPAATGLGWAAEPLDAARRVRDRVNEATGRPGGERLRRPLDSGTLKLAPKDMDDLAALLREHAGVDPDDPADTPNMSALLAVGLTNGLWRNSPLENTHAASSSPHLNDEAMMLHNIATTRHVATHVHDGNPDLDAIQHTLIDPGRVLPGPITARELLEGEWNAYLEHITEQLGVLRDSADTVGPELTAWRAAAHGALACVHWWGTPWWPDVLDVFFEQLADRSSDAWRYDNGEPEPDQAADRDRLRQLLADRPDELTADTAAWCVVHGLRHGAAIAGRDRFKARRGAVG